MPLPTLLTLPNALGLFALVNRATFYRLADLALAEGAEPPGLWSDGAFFPFMQGIDDAA